MASFRRIEVHVKPGLTVLRENMLDKSAMVNEDALATKDATYCCLRCGNTKDLRQMKTQPPAMFAIMQNGLRP